MTFVRELIDCIEPLGGQNSRVWAEIKSNRYSIGVEPALISCEAEESVVDSRDPADGKKRLAARPAIEKLC